MGITPPWVQMTPAVSKIVAKAVKKGLIPEQRLKTREKFEEEGIRRAEGRKPEEAPVQTKPVKRGVLENLRKLFVRGQS